MGAAPSQILPGLFQGGADVLEDEKWFKDNNVTHVLSLGPQKVHFEWLKVVHIDVPDIQSADLSEYMKEAAMFVHNGRIDGGTVYVHCQAGVSRSSTMTIVYLMSFFLWDYDTAFQTLRKGRKSACPNGGFQEQLRKFESDKVHHELHEIMKQHESYEQIRKRDEEFLEKRHQEFLEARKQKRRDSE